MVVEGAEAVAPDDYKVGARLVVDLHDLLARPTRANHEIPDNAFPAQQSQDLLLDLRLLVVERPHQLWGGDARRHHCCRGKMPNIDHHYLCSDSGSKVRDLLEASTAGR